MGTPSAYPFLKTRLKSGNLSQSKNNNNNIKGEKIK